MNLEAFRKTLASDAPPAGLSRELLVLWHDARGDWNAAHQVVQALDTPAGAWLHAYLHRKEGDQANAGYWYRRAGQPVSQATLDEEWAQLAEHFLG